MSSSIRIFRATLIVFASVYIGSSLAFLTYYLMNSILSGSYSLVKDYFSGFIAIIVWTASSLLVGSFIELKTQKAHKK